MLCSLRLLCLFAAQELNRSHQAERGRSRFRRRRCRGDAAKRLAVVARQVREIEPVNDAVAAVCRAEERRAVCSVDRESEIVAGVGVSWN